MEAACALVARGRIELPTRGFSVRRSDRSLSLRLKHNKGLSPWSPVTFSRPNLSRTRTLMFQIFVL